MKVEILGVGCAKCNALYDIVTEIENRKEPALTIGNGRPSRQ